MARRIVSYAERPELDDRWDETVAPVWPEFLLHGSDVNERWSHLFEHDEAFQCFLVEEESDEVLAVANTIPFAWDGEPEGLPGGVDDVLATAITQHDAGEAPNTLCADPRRYPARWAARHRRPALRSRSARAPPTGHR